MTATAHVGAPHRPDRAALLGMSWRAALVVAAAVAVALDAPAWLRAPLSLAAFVAVAAVYAARARHRGVLDTALLVPGVALVGLALAGLLLNLLPVGLSAPGWAAATAAGELAVLAVLTLRRPSTAPAGRLRRPSAAALAWTGAVAAVLLAAVLWSASSFSSTHVAPLAVEAQPDGASTTVTITSGSEEGPYRVDLVTDGGRRVLARDVRVGPERPATVQVRLETGTRALVQLVRPGTATPVRELILDTSAGAGA